MKHQTMQVAVVEKADRRVKVTVEVRGEMLRREVPALLREVAADLQGMGPGARQVRVVLLVTLEETEEPLAPQVKVVQARKKMAARVWARKLGLRFR